MAFCGKMQPRVLGFSIQAGHFISLSCLLRTYWTSPCLLCRDRSTAARRCACLYFMYVEKSVRRFLYWHNRVKQIFVLYILPFELAHPVAIFYFHLNQTSKSLPIGNINPRSIYWRISSYMLKCSLNTQSEKRGNQETRWSFRFHDASSRVYYSQLDALRGWIQVVELHKHATVNEIKSK